jgi:hypothetical protein
LYSGATPTPANPKLIPSSQAFFVKLGVGGTYNATMSLKETAKSTSTSGQFQRVNAESQLLRISMSKSMNTTDYGYDAIIRFIPGATDGYDFSYDFESMSGNNFNLGIPVDNSLMSIATFSPIVESKIVPIRVSYNSNYGNFYLKFTEMDVLLEDNSIFLRDNLLGTIEQITPGFVYNYTASSTDGLLAERFELLFNPNSLTGVNSAMFSGSGMNIFPNPGSQGKSTTIMLHGFSSGTAKVVVYDALGKSVFNKSVELDSRGSGQFDLSNDLPSGVYTVKSVGGSLTFNQKLVIR